MLPESYPAQWLCEQCECIFAEMVGHRLEQEWRFCPECGRRIISFDLAQGREALKG
jgi:hypothetical protein